MDPLSITASVIAVITLTGTITTCLNDLRTAWKDAPDDFHTLQHEIAEFNAVLSNIRDLCTNPSAVAFGGLCSRAEGKLLELESILHEKILRHVSATGKVPKARWMGVRGKIEAIKEALRDIRLQLVTALMSFTARRALAADSRFEMIEFSLQELSSGQQTILNEITQLPLSSDPARDPRPCKSSQEDDEDSISQISTASVQPGNPLGSAEPANAQQVSRLTTPTFSEWQCKPWCACLCHRRHLWHMPKSLRTFLGDLQLYYSGAFWGGPACTESMCRRPSTPNTNVTYSFPAWLAARAVMVELGGPSFCLRAVAVVPEDAPIMVFARTGNVEGIQTLFKSRLASPFDVDPDGWTPLTYAAVDDRMDVCRMLMQAGANLRTEPQTGGTTFHMALWWGIRGQLEYYEIFQLWDVIPEQGYSRLHKIILNIIPGDIETELALSTANINAPDAWGLTPLWWAVYFRETKQVESLLHYNASVNIANSFGCTPLILAALWNSVFIIDKLLLAGADLHAVDRWGRSALKCAHVYKTKKAITFLMDCGSELENKSELFLQLAEEYGYGTRVIEDVTDEAFDEADDENGIEEPDLNDTEDIAKALDTLGVHTSELPTHTIPQSP